MILLKFDWNFIHLRLDNLGLLNGMFLKNVNFPFVLLSLLILINLLMNLVYYVRENFYFNSVDDFNIRVETCRTIYDSYSVCHALTRFLFPRTTSGLNFEKHYGISFWRKINIESKCAPLCSFIRAPGRGLFTRMVEFGDHFNMVPWLLDEPKSGRGIWCW